MKGQLIADFLTAHPCPDNEELPDDGVMLVETKLWKLYFDGTIRTRKAKVGIVFVKPSGGLIPYSFSLLKACSNNMAEYEAIIIGLALAIEMHIDQLDMLGDSQLITPQINGQYEVRNPRLVLLYQRTKNLMAQFLLSIGKPRAKIRK